jgi:hypothetical protein
MEDVYSLLFFGLIGVVISGFFLYKVYITLGGFNVFTNDALPLVIIIFLFLIISLASIVVSYLEYNELQKLQVDKYHKIETIKKPD